jgi:hypothetical protein
MLGAWLVDIASHRETEQMFGRDSMRVTAVAGATEPMRPAMVVPWVSLAVAMLSFATVRLPARVSMHRAPARRILPSPDLRSFLPKRLFPCARRKGAADGKGGNRKATSHLS